MPPSRRRDPYIQVGEALRTLVANAATESLRAREYRVLLGILHYTVSYSKLSDELSIDALVDVTGIDRRNVRRALGELHDRGIVVYEPGESRPGQRRKRSRVRLPDPTDRGSTEPPVEDAGPGVPQAPGLHQRPGAPPTPGTGGPTSPRSPSERPGVQQAHDRGSTEPRTGGPPSPPSEKYPRNPPEARAHVRTPAPTRTRETAPPDDTTSDRGRDDEINDDTPNTDQLLARLPGGIAARIGRAHRRKLEPTITAHLDRGWTPHRLLKAITDQDRPGHTLADAGSPAGAITHRLREIGDPPRPRQPRPKCSTCEGPGLIVDLDNVARPCPDCRPEGIHDTTSRLDRPTPDPIDALLDPEAARG